MILSSFFSFGKERDLLVLVFSLSECCIQIILGSEIRFPVSGSRAIQNGCIDVMQAALREITYIGHPVNISKRKGR